MNTTEELTSKGWCECCCQNKSLIKAILQKSQSFDTTPVIQCNCSCPWSCASMLNKTSGPDYMSTEKVWERSKKNALERIIVQQKIESPAAEENQFDCENSEDHSTKK